MPVKAASEHPSQKVMVAEALETGLWANQEVANYIKKKWKVDCLKNIPNLKSLWKKEQGESKASSHKQSKIIKSPTAKASGVNSVNVDDLQAVAALVKKIGADKVKAVADVVESLKG